MTGRHAAMGMMAITLMVAPLQHAAAQQKSAGAASATGLSQRLAACRAITDDTARLACFDAAAAALAGAEAAGEVRLVDRATVQEARRAVFGFSLPRINLLGDDEDEGARVREISGTLAEVRPFSRGLHLLVLADGSRWQTTEERTNFFPRSGDTITIAAGALGSYVARIDDGRSIRVKRIN
ncbi:hypothetical protein V5740_12320 [Croceibacterium sp. TMG7-5b_MA50]|uniref:hypothetical protein n=1 Tax=Croceibacterium sp. TMG7-5b_MA50 TaxID=3121290 RepID=UPI00322221B7